MGTKSANTSTERGGSTVLIPSRGIKRKFVGKDLTHAINMNREPSRQST